MARTTHRRAVGRHRPRAHDLAIGRLLLPGLAAMTLAACGGAPQTDPPTGTTGPADAYAIAGGSGAGRAVTTFADGSAVVTGRGSGSFGNLVAAGPLFVGKVEADGTWAWVSSAGSGPATGTDFQPYAVSALADGGTLVAGSFRGTMPLGSLELVGVTDRPDAFVAKIDADGAWVWATGAGGSDDEVATAVSATSDGGAFVAGWLDSDDAAFGTTVVASNGSYDTFVARMDASGAWSWVVTPVGDGKAESITAMPDGGAIVVGWFTGSMTFGAHSISASNVDTFVARIDATGTWDWAVKVGGSSGQLAQDVSPLPDGGAVVVGYFFDTATFGPLSISSPAGGNDAFVAKVDGDGSWVWATSASGLGDTLANGVRGLADGGAVVVGHVRGGASFGGNDVAAGAADDYAAFVAKVDAGGAWLWAVGGGGSGFDAMNAVGAWTDGSAVATGSFIGPGTFGSGSLAAGNGFDQVVVAKVTADGDW